jgi:branched-chain amino acid transport system substrate-binding protein
VGLDAVILINVWGFDERTPELVGGAAKGRIAGITPFLYPMFAGDSEGMRTILEAARKYGVPEDQINVRFVQGFVNVWLLVKAIESVTSQDLLERRGEALKEALETYEFDFGGITADTLRFKEGYHVPYKTVFIVLYSEDGSLKLVGKYTAPEGIDCAAITAREG